ncbi:MAG: hypothetical protein NTY64_23040 [Deltaproteobacteria bacterium]|nr:hypothetical protein [Deltaproteobacteria bacterium]
MKKKIVLWAGALMMLLAFAITAGCGGSGSSTTSSTTSSDTGSVSGSAN